MAFSTLTSHQRAARFKHAPLRLQPSYQTQSSPPPPDLPTFAPGPIPLLPIFKSSNHRLIKLHFLDSPCLRCLAQQHAGKSRPNLQIPRTPEVHATIDLATFLEPPKPMLPSLVMPLDQIWQPSLSHRHRRIGVAGRGMKMGPLLAHGQCRTDCSIGPSPQNYSYYCATSCREC